MQIMRILQLLGRLIRQTSSYAAVERVHLGEMGVDRLLALRIQRAVEVASLHQQTAIAKVGIVIYYSISTERDESSFVIIEAHNVLSVMIRHHRKLFHEGVHKVARSIYMHTLQRVY